MQILAEIESVAGLKVCWWLVACSLGMWTTMSDGKVAKVVLLFVVHISQGTWNIIIAPWFLMVYEAISETLFLDTGSKEGRWKKRQRRSFFEASKVPTAQGLYGERGPLILLRQQHQSRLGVATGKATSSSTSSSNTTRSRSDELMISGGLSRVQSKKRAGIQLGQIQNETRMKKSEERGETSKQLPVSKMCFFQSSMQAWLDGRVPSPCADHHYAQYIQQASS